VERKATKREQRSCMSPEARGKRASHSTSLRMVREEDGERSRTILQPPKMRKIIGVKKSDFEREIQRFILISNPRKKSRHLRLLP